MMMPNKNDHDLVMTEPVNLQSRPEEADTLVAFHEKQAPERNILLRSTETNVLVIFNIYLFLKNFLLLLFYTCPTAAVAEWLARRTR